MPRWLTGTSPAGDLRRPDYNRRSSPRDPCGAIRPLAGGSISRGSDLPGDLTPFMFSVPWTDSVEGPLKLCRGHHRRPRLLTDPKGRTIHALRGRSKTLWGSSGTHAALHAKFTDFGGSKLPEFPIISILRPTRCNCIIYNRISQIVSISMLCNDCRTDTL
jgi:hypothetical protein